MSPAAFIGLGSNMGDSRTLLDRAVKEIDAWPDIRVTAASSLYVTEPLGDTDQPLFLNQVVRVEYPDSLEPESFLHRLQDLENSLGRQRDPGRRFGPRPIDLDLLLFGNTRMNTGRLTLPHPRMLERAFVLVPLAEIVPGLMLTGGGTVEEALALISFERAGNRIYQKN